MAGHEYKPQEDGTVAVPEEPFVASFEGNTEAVDWAVTWLTEAGEGPTAATSVRAGTRNRIRFSK